MWHAYVEENQVTVAVHGFFDGFQTVFGLAANSKAIRGLDKLSNGTAHGGAIVRNENSWPAPNIHVEEDSSDPVGLSLLMSKVRSGRGNSKPVT